MPVDTGLAYFISAKKKERQQSAGRRQEKKQRRRRKLEDWRRGGTDETRGVMREWGTLEATRDTCVPDSNLNCSVSSITYK